MMDFDNGIHTLGFDFELGNHDLTASISTDLFSNSAESHNGFNDMSVPVPGCTSSTNGTKDGLSNIVNERGIDGSLDMDTENNTELTHETSSETGNASENENESDFEELDLSAGMVTDVCRGKEAENVQSDEMNLMEEVAHSDSEKHDEKHDSLEGKSSCNSNEPSTNNGTTNPEALEKEGEINEEDTDQAEPTSTVKEKDVTFNEQNNDPNETNEVQQVTKSKESDQESTETDSESYEDNEVMQSEQGAENQQLDNIDNEQIQSARPVGNRHSRKRKRRRGKSYAKKWSRVTPYKSKAVTPTRSKFVKTDESSTSIDTMNTSKDTSAVEKDVTMDDVNNSQVSEEGDASTANDDSVSESPLGRRISRPPSSKGEFTINDDALLDEMWKHTDPSAMYRKKRKSILFQTPKRMRVKQTDLKPLTEEERQKYSEPFKHGWKREIVIRACHGEDVVKKNPPSDVYYFPPVGSKLRSMVQLAEYLEMHPSELTQDNFTFMRRQIGAEGEVTRNANLQRGRSTSAPRRSRVKESYVGDIRNDNDPLYDKPEVVIERDSDEFLTPIIAESIRSPSKEMKKDTLSVGTVRRGRPSKRSISLIGPSNDAPVVKMMHPSREEVYIMPSKTQFKATARKSTTPKVAKLPIPYVGVENLCSLKCPGLEGVSPLLHCNVCMCLFHKKCVNYSGDEDNFTCLRCGNMTNNENDEHQENAPMHLDPNLVKTLNSFSHLSSSQMPSTSSLIHNVSNTGGSMPLYKSPIYETMNDHSTKSPVLFQHLYPNSGNHSKSVQSKNNNQSSINLAANVKQEPVDDSYNSSMNSDAAGKPENTNKATTEALSRYLNSKSTSTPDGDDHLDMMRNKVNSFSQSKPMVSSNPRKYKAKTFAQNPRRSMSQVIPLPNTGFQLIPIGPPLSLAPGQSLLSGVRPAAGIPSPLQQMGSPLVPLQIGSNIMLQGGANTSNTTGNSSVAVNVSPQLSSPVSTTDSGNNQTGPVVVNAKSCAPLNGQLLTLPPAVVKRLTLTKPLALKINNRQINVPPSGYFQTAGGLKVFLPPNTFPTAEDNVVPGIDVKDTEKSPDKTNQSKTETDDGKVDKDTPNKANENTETVDKSALIRKSKRYKKLCFIKLLFGAFDCMECIFKRLNIQDLVSASKVCKRWRTIAQNTSLWHHVSFRDMQVSDWRKAMQFLNKRQVKSISLVGLKHCNDPNRTWHQLVSSLQEIQNLQQIAFGVVPASVLHSLTTRLTKLESFHAEYIADPSSDPSKVAPCKLDVGKFAAMSELKELKLRGVNGLVPPSFSFSGGLSELGSLSSLEVLSVTSLQDVSQDNFHFMSQLLNIRELCLGDCTSWTNETCEQLGQLVGLEKLRLENGSELCRSSIGEAISHLKKLHTLELHDFPIEDNLGSHLKSLNKLKTLVLYPFYSTNIAKDNINALNGVGELTWLERLDWVLPDKNRMSIILDDNDNKEEEEDTQFVPFLITASISEEEGIVANHMEYINPKELTEKLMKKLPKTQVKVYSCTVKEKEVK